jgi:hypothetical protein
VKISAQATPIAQSGDIVPGKPSAAATTNDEGPAGIVPFVKGPNISLATTSQHDSSDGWSTVLTPDFAWRFNRAFSADASVPIYGYINILVTGGTKAKPVYTQETKKFIAGDTALNGHFEINPDLFTYALTASMGLPSGNTDYGLGAGQVTYNFNNHFEHSFDWFTPDIELGIGDNSALIGQRVLKSYVSVGTLATSRPEPPSICHSTWISRQTPTKNFPSPRRRSTPRPARARRRKPSPPAPASPKTTVSPTHSTFRSAATSRSPASTTEAFARTSTPPVSP